MITLIAYIVIFLWAVWCVLSDQVKDGIFGKLMYASIAISAMVATFYSGEVMHARTDVTLIVCFALIGARHFIVRQYKAWKGAKCSTSRP